MAVNNSINTGALSAGIIKTDGAGTLSTTAVTQHSVLVGGTSNAITSASVGTNGQVLIAATTADPAFATLTSTGGTIVYTTGANTLNLEATAVPITWTDVTGTSASMAINHGYIADNAGLVTLTLPSTAALGSIIWVTGKGAGGWTIVENSGQQIFFGTSSTTTTTGSLSSTAQRDTVQLVCITANTTWNVITSIGNITVA
jgi:hypothetical protein